LKKRLLIAPIMVMTLALTGAMASADTTVTDTATAEIQMRFAIENAYSSLSFGTIKNAGHAQFITVDKDGTWDGNDETNSIVYEGTPGTFTVTGPALDCYGIELPESISLASSTGASMNVKDFTAFSFNTQEDAWSDEEGHIIFITGHNGSDTLYVGASLDIEPNQEPGVYSGMYHVTVVYP